MAAHASVQKSSNSECAESTLRRLDGGEWLLRPCVTQNGAHGAPYGGSSGCNVAILPIDQART